ncbi:hypothetical protein FRC07_014089 [Ceratobasidium sp. 392]|nr:hypothetical protein FRC07_014089 [Ceratobasidium sp. 392]
MIRSPAVERLELESLGVSNDRLLWLADQLAPPSVLGDDAITAPAKRTTRCCPTYPALQSLYISRLVPDDDCTEGFRALLSSLPTITVLAAPRTALQSLAEEPWLLPHLESIACLEYPFKDLGSILRQMLNGGSPLKGLEIQKKYFESIRMNCPELLGIIKLFAIDAPDYNANEDEDDEDDDKFGENSPRSDTPDTYYSIYQHNSVSDGSQFCGIVGDEVAGRDAVTKMGMAEAKVYNLVMA